MAEAPQKQRLYELLFSGEANVTYFDALILNYIEKNTGCNMTQVCRYFQANTNIQERTIRLTMERLYHKGLIEREQNGREKYLHIAIGAEEPIKRLVAAYLEAVEKVIKNKTLTRALTGSAKVGALKKLKESHA